jgi:hypothetical protein
MEGKMESLVQVFFNRFASAPRAWIKGEGAPLIARAVALVREKEGEVAARHLENLMAVSEAVD